MTEQLALFAAPTTEARRPMKADTPMLLAMSDGHRPARATKQVAFDSDDGRDLIASAQAISNSLIGSPELKETFRKLGYPEYNQPPSEAMRWHILEQEHAIAEAEAAAEIEQEEAEPEPETQHDRYTCADCGLDYTGAGNPIEDSEGKRCFTCHRTAHGTALDPETFEALDASYSADTIGCEGRTRKPCLIGQTEWVSIGGGRMGGQRKHARAYRLAPDDGTALPYAEHNFRGQQRETMGGYHGMAVKVRGKPMMLVGPEQTFVEGDDPQGAML